MSRAIERPLFTFAVISDSHVNEAEDHTASPFASNLRANARFRYVVEDLNRREPDFVVHLGDMGNPLPDLATYPDAAASFQRIAAGLTPPMHLVPGNHCVGDKPRGWVPVPRVGARSLALYEATYGKSYYSFDRDSVHFVALNSLIIGSELESEAEQKRWLADDLSQAARAGRRIFVMMHYPAFVAGPDEPGSYDNLDEPGRSWLLGEFERFGVEAAYSGHVHNYFYNRFAGTELYTVPAISFVRQDYSELFRVAPADGEGGRDDVVKLGYFLVRIFEGGHHNEFVRTYGRALNDGARLGPQRRLESSPARPLPPNCLGTEMRDNWLSRETLRPNNSVSPFTRRRARNDWAVLALGEMGIAKVRMALQELVKRDAGRRIGALGDAGFEFTVYSHGIPGDAEYEALRQYGNVLAGWELMLSVDQVDFVAARILGGGGGLARTAGLPRYLDEVRDIDAADIVDANVKHVSNYGFQVKDLPAVERLGRSEDVRRAFAGFVFRLGRGGSAADLWTAIARISDNGSVLAMRHQVHVLFSGNVTAERFEDDLANANRVAEATLAALCAGNVDLYFDTFEDVDRGYFVRTGLVDRRYNPRLAASVLRHLNAALPHLRDGAAGGEISGAQSLAGGRVLSGRVAEDRFWLVLPEPRCEVPALAKPEVLDEAVLSLEVVDLASGNLIVRSGEASGDGYALDEPLLAESPLLAVQRQP